MYLVMSYLSLYCLWPLGGRRLDHGKGQTFNLAVGKREGKACHANDCTKTLGLQFPFTLASSPVYTQ